MGKTETYTDRKTEHIILTKKDATSIGWRSMGVGSIPEEVTDKLVVGDSYIIEWYTSTTIGGLMYPSGAYLFRRSDEFFTAQYEKANRNMEEHYKKMWEDDKEDWAVRILNLPDRYRDDMIEVWSKYRNAESYLERSTIGYELIPYELAIMYALYGVPVNTLGEKVAREIDEYDRLNGCSGTQHSKAIALAKLR